MALNSRRVDMPRRWTSSVKNKCGMIPRRGDEMVVSINDKECCIIKVET